MSDGLKSLLLLLTAERRLLLPFFAMSGLFLLPKLFLTLPRRNLVLLSARVDEIDLLHI